ncbi:MAG: preprotein translocase subunit SecE [Anaeroplasmataceae bacterium]
MNENKDDLISKENDANTPESTENVIDALEVIENSDSLSSTENIEENKKNKKSKKKKNKKKEIKNELEHRSRILEYLKNEHAWENYVLLILSVVALLLGVLILNDTLSINADFPVIGSFPTQFAWVLVVLSTIALLLSLYPFFKPSYPELKKVTWPTWKKFLADSVRVFIFIIALTLLLLLFDIFISKLVALILQ